jgi:hypothetical protein
MYFLWLNDLKEIGENPTHKKVERKRIKRIIETSSKG